MDFYLHHSLINDVNTRTEEGYTPLHLAVLCGHTSVVEHLCALGCDINAQTLDGSSPLHLAAKRQRSEIAKYLIDAGCRFSWDSAGMTPSLYALHSNNPTLVELFHSAEVEHGPENHERRAYHQLMRRKAFALSFDDAILHNNLRHCQDLVARGFDFEVPLRSCGGCSPLVKAIMLERTAIVKWLLDNGASLSRVFCDVRPGVTAVHLLLENPNMVEILPLAFECYLKQGGTILGASRSLIVTAAASDNTYTGLKLLLEHLVHHKEQYA
ncbi:ankyrin [Colletotrichum zoysiae]|uniref:Ankyrin n=1 Tax=Colletotrichum zoysiae TaxID=1216348 RepID=A0AAD9M7F2_9PEZI|nr:ankyrin [Colletotrichum zoysiae]